MFRVDDSPAEAAFRSEARAWLEANARRRTPTGNWSERHTHLTREAEDAWFERCRAWQRTLFDGGYAAISWPVEHGGRGGTYVQQMIFDEEAADFDVTSGFLRSMIALVGAALRGHATEEQRRRYLARLLRGDEMWCQLFSEPGAGSDLAGLGTRAERDGDHFIVNGQKVWTSAARHADFGILLARTNPDAPKHRGITFFVVDMHQPGIEVRPLRQITGASEFNEVFLTDVVVPVENVVGEVDGGWAPGRTVLAAESVMIGGLSRADRTARLLLEAGERGRTDDPIVRDALARLVSRERVLEWMLGATKLAVRLGQPPPIDGSVLKVFWAETLIARGDAAMQVMGPDAIVGDDSGSWQLELLSRYGGTIGGGTSEVHRNNMGERVLGLPREPRVDHEVAWRDLAR
jgi:alkylation response protein AidB-like acyl-CoA dehydrogenase